MDEVTTNQSMEANTDGGSVSVEVRENDETENLVSFQREFSAARSAVKDIRRRTHDLERLYSEQSRLSDAAQVAEDFPRKIAEGKSGIVAVVKDVKIMSERLGESAGQQSEQSAEARMQSNQCHLLHEEFSAALQAFYRADLAGQQRVESAESPPRGEQGDAAGSGGVKGQLQSQGVSQAMQNHMNVRIICAAEEALAMGKILHEFRELEAIMHDMSILVEQQGGLVNDIRNNVDSAIEYVHMGREEVQAATKYVKEGTKSKCYILICIIVGVLVVIAVVGISMNSIMG